MKTNTKKSICIALTAVAVFSAILFAESLETSFITFAAGEASSLAVAFAAVSRYNKLEGTAATAPSNGLEK